MKRLMTLIFIFNSSYSMFYKTASPNMMPRDALKKVEVPNGELPLYLALEHKGKWNARWRRQEAIRLVMPLSYKGLIASFYHGPLREMEVSMREAHKAVIARFNYLQYSGEKDDFKIYYEMDRWNQVNKWLQKLAAAIRERKNLTFTHYRNFERKKETITFPAREIPFK